MGRAYREHLSSAARALHSNSHDQVKVAAARTLPHPNSGNTPIVWQTRPCCTRNCVSMQRTLHACPTR